MDKFNRYPRVVRLGMLAGLSRKSSIARRALSGLVALAVGAGLLVASPAVSSAGNNRSWLRADDSRAHKCTWDKLGHELQYCKVWSPSMKRLVDVQIFPSVRGGSAGLYLLDGMRARNDYNLWARDARVHRTFTNDDVTIVMPIGGDSEWYTDWYAPSNIGNQKYTPKWETFITKELPPYLERNFGVSRHNNAIGGVSMSGNSALTIAAYHRNQFKQALSFSGYFHLSKPGTKSAIRAMMIATKLYNVDNMWGPPWDPAWKRNDSFVQAERLRGLKLYLSSSSGFPGGHNNIGDVLNPKYLVPGMLLEYASSLAHLEMDLNLLIRGIPHINAYHALGIHSPAYWHDEMKEARPYILEALSLI